MPLTGEYEPSTSDWAREQTERFEKSGGMEGNTLRGMPIMQSDVVNAVAADLEPAQARRAVHFKIRVVTDQDFCIGDLGVHIGGLDVRSSVAIRHPEARRYGANLRQLFVGQGGGNMESNIRHRMALNCHTRCNNRLQQS